MNEFNAVYTSEQPPPRKEYYLDLKRVEHIGGLVSNIITRMRLKFVTAEHAVEYRTKFNVRPGREVDKLRAYGPFKVYAPIKK